MSSAPALTWTSSSRTDVGMVREMNEDACIVRPEIGLWAVADGMGGHDAGDMASGMVIEAIADVEAHDDLAGLLDDVEDRLLAVNARLREIAAERESHTIGSTVASLLAGGEHCICAWAGDSRVYRYRARQLRKITQDHALVEELVEKGVLTREEAANHPQTNLVTRAVGASSNLYLDVEIYDLRAGDVYVLCSDGLDKEISEDEIARVITEAVAAPQSAAEGTSLSDRLVERALARGARDNVTVVTVEVGGDGRTADTRPGTPEHEGRGAVDGPMGGPMEGGPPFAPEAETDPEATIPGYTGRRARRREPDDG